MMLFNFHETLFLNSMLVSGADVVFGSRSFQNESGVAADVYAGWRLSGVEQI